jgi:hypothetical protein
MERPPVITIPPSIISEAISGGVNSKQSEMSSTKGWSRGVIT